MPDTWPPCPSSPLLWRWPWASSREPSSLFVTRSVLPLPSFCPAASLVPPVHHLTVGLPSLLLGVRRWSFQLLGLWASFPHRTLDSNLIGEQGLPAFLPKRLNFPSCLILCFLSIDFFFFLRSTFLFIHQWAWKFSLLIGFSQLFYS